MADDTDRTEAAIRARIDLTRNRMGETIEEIGAHLNPDHLKHEFSEGLRDQVEYTKREFRDATIGRAEELMHNVEETVNHTSRTLRDTIRDNPIPAAMAGIGLGWLIADARSHAKDDSRYYEQTDGWARSRRPYPEAGPGYVARPEYGERPPARAATGIYADMPPVNAGASTADRARDRTSEVAGQARAAADRARDTASEVGDQARSAADRAQDKLSETADRAQRTASEAADWAQDTAHHAWDRAEYRATQAQRMAQANPLAAGAVAMALGFAAGMIIPETRQENRLMGPARDRLVDRAEDMAHRTAERVERVVEKTAEEAGSTAREEANRQGLTDASSLKP